MGPSERSERGWPRNYEVLGFITDFDLNLDFLGFPIILLGSPGISGDFYQDLDSILILI